MPRNTSVTLGNHFEGFIANKIAEGRFESKSEAVRAGMRLLEEHEQKIELLKIAINEGEESGESTRTLQEIAEEARKELENEI